MMKAAASRAALCLGLTAACCTPAWGQWWWPPTDGLTVSPACRDPWTHVSLTIGGDWPDSCIPNFSSVVRNGSEIDVFTVRDPPPGICLSVITQWQRTESVGPGLQAGTYTVYATHRVAGQVVHPRTQVGTFQVVALCTTVCYPNCDGSTIAPILNVGDFTCFLNRYAAQDPWTNCDSSTVAPILNVGDFVCFLNRYAAGCS